MKVTARVPVGLLWVILSRYQALNSSVSALFQCFRLVHEEIGCQNHAVADYVYLVALENARGDAAQHIFLPLELQRVPCVGTTLESGHHVITGSEHVDYLSLSFIAPLQSQQDVNLSFVHRDNLLSV